MNRSKPGPRPDPSKPYSRHREDVRETVWLPPMGCEDPPPDLPPGRTWSDAEGEIWRGLWASPAASQWDESMMPVVAALVVATSTILSGPRPSAQLIGEVRALTDSLGLTPAAMSRLGWRVGEPAEAQVYSINGERR